MSWIRPGSEKLYSNSDNNALYVFLGGARGEHYIEDYGHMRNPEDFCEAVFRIFDRAGVDVDKEMVNKVRDELNLEELDEVG